MRIVRGRAGAMAKPSGAGKALKPIFAMLSTFILLLLLLWLCDAARNEEAAEKYEVVLFWLNYFILIKYKMERNDPKWNKMKWEKQRQRHILGAWTIGHLLRKAIFRHGFPDEWKPQADKAKERWRARALVGETERQRIGEQTREKHKCRNQKWEAKGNGIKWKSHKRMGVRRALHSVLPSFHHSIAIWWKWIHKTMEYYFWNEIIMGEIECGERNEMKRNEMKWNETAREWHGAERCGMEWNSHAWH